MAAMFPMAMASAIAIAVPVISPAAAPVIIIPEIKSKYESRGIRLSVYRRTGCIIYRGRGIDGCWVIVTVIMIGKLDAWLWLLF
jgi:hypothetical protein